VISIIAEALGVELVRESSSVGVPFSIFEPLFVGRGPHSQSDKAQSNSSSQTTIKSTDADDPVPDAADGTEE